MSPGQRFYAGEQRQAREEGHGRRDQHDVEDAQEAVHALVLAAVNTMHAGEPPLSTSSGV